LRTSGEAERQHDADGSPDQGQPVHLARTSGQDIAIDEFTRAAQGMTPGLEIYQA